jgi:AcrR family transcriptional regulator
MARRSDHTRDELHELIITTAIDIIEEQGFAALSARKISGRIGYAAGTIYNVYASMDDLIVTINARSLDMMAEQISQQDYTATPADQLKSMARIYLDFVHGHKGRWYALFTHRLTEGSILPPWFEAKISALFMPIEQAVLALHADSGQSSRDSAKLAARTLWASVHGICFIDQSGKMPLVSEDHNAQNMVNCLIDNFCRGAHGTSQYY